jgi:signal recognition particle GTPase
MSLDTHKLARDLEAASISPAAATAIVEALQRAASDYATKDDLETQRVRIMSEISTAVAKTEATLVRELHTVVNRGVVMIILGLSAIGGAVTIVSRIWGH